jgi:hypothetical protein
MLSKWLWIMVCYTEPGGYESWCVMLSQWLLIMVCYDEPVVVNRVELCWASGCESCVMLSQWLWIMLCYSEPVGVIHGALCWPIECESWCAIQIRVVVNHCVLCWAVWLWIMCYTELGGCEWCCAILSQWVWIIVWWLWIMLCYTEPGDCESCCIMLSRVVVNHGVLC